MAFILLVGIILGAILAWVLYYLFIYSTGRCKHEYKLIKSGDITNFDRRGESITVGFLKLYECKHCKKLKTQKAYVN
jgi:hypothetical protein